MLDTLPVPLDRFPCISMIAYTGRREQSHFVALRGRVISGKMVSLHLPGPIQGRSMAQWRFVRKGSRTA